MTRKLSGFVVWPVVILFCLLSPCLGQRVVKVELDDGSVIQGLRSYVVGEEYFKGIRFAEPPVGRYRFRMPRKYNGSYDGLQAFVLPKQCYMSAPLTAHHLPLPADLITLYDNSKVGTVIPPIGFDEDCLILNVYRPIGVAAPRKVPVILWIYSGGFAWGGGTLYDGGAMIRESQRMRHPVIIVTFNYRSAAYGWLGGRQIENEGEGGNFGLIDQRLVMEWVQDNIAAFGGDPDNVTLMGISSGAMSIAHHLVLYDGDHTYKGKRLFHGAIMSSGSLIGLKPLASKVPQDIFDHIARVSNCLCSDDAKTMQCLRSLPPERLNGATNTVPGLFAYGRVGISFGPRWAEPLFSAHPYDLLSQGKFARVPMIIGSQEDEGTLFAFLWFQFWNGCSVRRWLRTTFTDMTSRDVNALLRLYPWSPPQGSPYHTGFFNVLHPEYKRLASIIGDLFFQWPRRYVLDHVRDQVPTWSFLGRYFRWIPFVGTFHANDQLFMFFTDTHTVPGSAYRCYFISFAYYKDPNRHSGLTRWPQYWDGKQSLFINPFCLSIGKDDHRRAQSEYINAHMDRMMY